MYPYYLSECFDGRKNQFLWIMNSLIMATKQVGTEGFIDLYRWLHNASSEGTLIVINNEGGECIY